MHKIRRSLTLGLGLAVLAPVVAPSLAGAELQSPEAAAGVAWLEAQQQADGGFELAGFPGFETADAIFALNSQLQCSQAGGPWNPTYARQQIAAIESTEGKDPLDAIDDLIDGEADPASIAASARAAKIAALVAQPLDIDAADFDPSGDSAGAVDLYARIDERLQGDGTYAFGAQFNGLLYTAVALGHRDGAVPPALVTQIRDAQRADGSWDYTGTTTGGGDDIDTTALALIALRSARVATDDSAITDAVAWLASRQQASGAWQAYGADDPNSTATATLALTDVRIDLSTAAWRTDAGSPATGTYVSPQQWLRSQATAAGNIASPNDTFGLNTFPTSQALQALGCQWFVQDERAALYERWAPMLTSPAAGPTVPVGEGGFLLGPNPSERNGRLWAATVVLNGYISREAAAADLFQQAFGRTIDPSGRSYWGAKLFTLSRPEVLARLTGSSEFYRRAGSTIPTFVDKVYLSVLGRNPDPSGRAYWIKKLQTGSSVQSVARSLTASNEYRRKQVDAAYLRVLDRAPSAGERSTWTARIATTRIEVLLAELASSAELYEALEG